MISFSVNLRAANDKITAPDRTGKGASVSEFEVLVGQHSKKSNKNLSSNSDVWPEIPAHKLQLQKAEALPESLPAVGIDQDQSNQRGDTGLDDEANFSNRPEQSDFQIQTALSKAEEFGTSAQLQLENQQAQLRPMSVALELQSVGPQSNEFQQPQSLTLTFSATIPAVTPSHENHTQPQFKALILPERLPAVAPQMAKTPLSRPMEKANFAASNNARSLDFHGAKLELNATKNIIDTQMPAPSDDVIIQLEKVEKVNDINTLRTSRQGKQADRSVEALSLKDVKDPISKADQSKLTESVIAWEAPVGKFQDGIASALKTKILELSPSTKALQVLVTSREQMPANVTELRIKLHPADFGQLNIRMQTVGDSLRVIVQTETEDAYARLVTEKDDLLHSLDIQGISKAEVTVLAPRNLFTETTQQSVSSQSGSTFDNKERQSYTAHEKSDERRLEKQLTATQDATERAPTSPGNYI